mmetsp:Transcript_11958/g.27683  ORF Transcript_11958/g.27683 Transcript_11958/m.27683 type:complete len:227 (+) Transcript_11958:638-1318(+)
MVRASPRSPRTRSSLCTRAKTASCRWRRRRRAAPSIRWRGHPTPPSLRSRVRTRRLTFSTPALLSRSARLSSARASTRCRSHARGRRTASFLTLSAASCPSSPPTTSLRDPTSCSSATTRPSRRWRSRPACSSPPRRTPSTKRARPLPRPRGAHAPGTSPPASPSLSVATVTPRASFSSMCSPTARFCRWASTTASSSARFEPALPPTTARCRSARRHAALAAAAL